MERLTEKVNGEYIHKVHKCSLNDCYEKLGKLEDLEEELGIPLEVLFKALKDGIWIINKEYVYDGYHIEVVLIGDKYNKFLLQDFNYDVWELKDYGKTWWLDKPKEEIS